MKELKDFFNLGETKSYDFRVNQLKTLKKMILENENQLLQALKNDLNKSHTESFFSEISPVLHEIDFALKNLKTWMKPTKTKTLPYQLFVKNIIYKKPMGCVLIISPWNYPKPNSLTTC